MLVVPVSFGTMLILGLIGFAIVGLALLPSAFDSWVRRVSRPPLCGYPESYDQRKHTSLFPVDRE
jgi:hypothetical protein